MIAKRFDTLDDREHVLVDFFEAKNKRDNELQNEELSRTSENIEMLETIRSMVSILIEDEKTKKNNKALKSENVGIIDIEEEKILKIEEGYEMKINGIKELQKIHISFLLISSLTIIFSLVGLLVFSASGFYIIHPSIYILGIFMGLGWGATCITSIITRRREN